MALLLNIDVPDLDSGVRFYTQAFGLTLGRRLGPGVAELLGWPAPLYLLCNEAGSIGAAADRRRYDGHWTPIHLDVTVAHLDDALARATAAGAVVETLPSDAPIGRIATLSDPFGHGFCLIEFNSRGYDALVSA